MSDPRVLSGAELAEERLTRWLADFAVSARFYAPTYKNPGEIKADIRSLLTALADESQKVSRLQAELDARKLAARAAFRVALRHGGAAAEGTPE